MPFSDPILLAAATEAAAETAQEAGVIGTLGLNWKLFLAQAFNFGIVVLILWKWVFRPVVGALESRRQRVESSVKKAEEIDQRLLALEQTEAAKIKDARAEADRILKEAEANASQQRGLVLADAKAEAEKIMVAAKTTITLEKEQLMLQARAELGEVVVLATEKILRAKLDESADHELITQTLKKVK